MCIAGVPISTLFLEQLWWNEHWQAGADRQRGANRHGERRLALERGRGRWKMGRSGSKSPSKTIAPAAEKNGNALAEVDQDQRDITEVSRGARQ